MQRETWGPPRQDVDVSQQHQRRPATQQAVLTTYSQQVDGSESCLCLALTRLHLESYMQFWVPQGKKDIEILEQIHQRTNEMMRGWTV